MCIIYFLKSVISQLQGYEPILTILLTKEKGVKICDLGVSKINELYTQLMTTHGRVNCAGTPMYMAPEIYINRQQATEYSDMWSFACTIVELFNEKHVWRIANSQKNLVKLLKEKRTPECDNLPDIIKAQVKKCFDYNYSSRPVAKEIIIFMKKMFETSKDNGN
uniref:Protein kinase domain-containing protein n=1 Tax=Trichogramma kaykai TaxID=54128 RepID=A0ABD2X961_9HYME